MAPIVGVRPAHVLRRISAFLHEPSSHPDLRRRILASARRRLPQSADATALAAAFAILEEATFKPSPPSLNACEQLLASLSRSCPLSALLLSLVHALRRRPVDAARSLLDLFTLDPSAAREELAPSVFEDLFVPHLLPVLRCFADEKCRILEEHSPGRPPPAGGDDSERGSASTEAAAAMSLLSTMSPRQAAQLKELEKSYEQVLDENTRRLAAYLKAVLENSAGSLEPPELMSLVVKSVSGAGYSLEEDVIEGPEVEEAEEMAIKTSIRRYNPIWSGADNSVDFLSTGFISPSVPMKSMPTHPRRIPANLVISQNPAGGAEEPPNMNSNSGPSFSSDFNSEDTCTCSDSGVEEENTELALFDALQIQLHRQEQPSEESTCSADPSMVDMDTILSSGKQTPPKDFICPITNHLFDDPVTLETGQTYERKAIQEWLDRGNSTCPITRQRLQTTELPKTNYVLKRLIASWQEQNHCPTPIQTEDAPPRNCKSDAVTEPPPSPTSVINQTTMDGAAVDLPLAISQLCTSEVLCESEAAVLQIELFWREAIRGRGFPTLLSAPAVVNGFVEILFNSVDSRVLRGTLYLLCELASRDKSVVKILTRVDSDAECVVALFKKGIMEAAVLVYLLKPSLERLFYLDMVDALLKAVKNNEEDLYPMIMASKSASLLLLGQIIRGMDDENISNMTKVLVSENVLEAIIECLRSDLMEQKLAAVGILLKCMEKERNCRNIIADKAELTPILDSFFKLGDRGRFQIISFFSELVKLNRRTFSKRLLHVIKDQAAFSMMHTLLNYLQTSSKDQTPIVAGLLLQLDILTEPRKMSMYREEAIDALISSLRDTEFPDHQIAAAEVILDLQGRFSSSGQPLARAFLLKRAGISRSHRSSMRSENMGHALEESEDYMEEEKAADAWERKMAFVLATHEFGLLFEALAEGLRGKSRKLFSTCLVSASWLAHMLSVLPDTGIRGAARLCLLNDFIEIFKSEKDSDDKALALVALRSFMHEPDGLQDLTLHVKDILKILRDLKKSSVLAYDMLKLFTEDQDSSIDLWKYKELAYVDCGMHGEVVSVVYFKGRIYSGHTDGTIKVWSGTGSVLHLIQQIQEHTKAVTSLEVSHISGKLYSGSLDKTVRVWSTEDEEIQCLEVHDTKDQVHNLTLGGNIACFIPQGAGIKVLSWNGGSKLLNSNKYVRCLSLVQGKLYCGCHDSSIQEIDLATGTLATIQVGSRKLLGKSSPIYALEIHDGLLYSAGPSLDGTTVKIRSTSDGHEAGSLASSMEVRSMALSKDLIYLGCKAGFVEIWSKEKLARVGTLQTGTGGRVQCMAVDSDGEVLIAGTSDGRLQAWGLS